LQPIGASVGVVLIMPPSPTAHSRSRPLWNLALVVCLVVTCPIALRAGDAAPASTGPEAWARHALSRCMQVVERLQEADDRLEARLTDSAQSREQASFLERERVTRERAGQRLRSAGLARLDTLLLGRKRRLSDLTRAMRGESFRLRDVLGEADACALEALEATTFFSVFGLPFDPTRTATPGRSAEFEILGATITEHLARGRTLEAIFSMMRPPPGDDTFAHVDAVARAALGLDPTHATDGVSPDLSARLRHLVEAMQLADEPMRIDTYLHWKVQQIEGAVGVPVPEVAAERLSRRAENLLFRNVTAMRRLQRADPAATMAALTPVLDEWFSATALPDIQRSLSRDPFAAYWLYVHSGVTATPGIAFKGSRVTLTPTLALSTLQGLPLEDALARIRDAQVPRYFLDRHAALEAAFSGVTLPEPEALARVDRGTVSPKVRERLRAFVSARAGPSGFSTIDVYSAIVRDASKIKGRVDWDVATAALDVLHDAKRERLDEVVAGIVARERGGDVRLQPYLTSAGALMLELERRQARERRFQQRTAGAVVGWILSQFLVGGGVPVELWPPEGVLGPEFAGLVDELTPKNQSSGNQYEGKAADRVALVHDGREYHEALVEIIAEARSFINVSAFDWKTDVGGRDIAYRLVAKKLGVDGPRYDRFLARFRQGLPITPTDAAPTPFYDIPTNRLKDLLVWYAFEESDHPDVAAAREAARAAGATLACTAVRTCGDLSALYELAESSVATAHGEGIRAREAYQRIEALFASRPPDARQVQRRRALRDYVEDPDNLRRFVRRVGLKRHDRPDEPFPINIVADSKQTFFNIHPRERSPYFPYLASDPIRDIYFPLLEFDIRLVLWKGPLEFPWRVGAVPLPGKKLFGKIPMPFIPYPWISAIPGFGWAGPVTSVFLQYLLASDPRVYWAMVNHTKSWSNEAMALESGMGMGSKYFNLYEEHKTWHDMGVVVHGPPVDDVNDHFVQVFNQARVNNTGIPSSRGVSIPKLDYADFRLPRAEPAATHRTWLLTTHPEQGDSNYRGVFMAAIAAARQNVFIENSFFSDPLIARMLMRKAREFRGRVNCEGLGDLACASAKRDAVRIHVILPDSSDKPIVDAVGAADFYEMLHLGIKVHRWNASEGWSAARMLHTKAWLIDYEPGRGGLAYVGAANATQRSHLSDNEAGILSTSPAFAREVHDRLFHPDLTTDSRLEPPEGLHVVRGSNAAVRASRWLRRLLVDLFWFI
jgi:phosphatidylserine/phosphatidylglycerophosphate/cardiolipin synthase-like enzyme